MGTEIETTLLLDFITPFGLSALLLYENLGDVDVNYSIYIVALLIFCGLNLTTYSLGLTSRVTWMRHSHQQNA